MGKAQELARSVAVDTREQTPWTWPDVCVERRTMKTGDYTLIDHDGGLLDHLVIIERKSLEDFVGCVGRGRERFERELVRLSETCRYPFVFIEGTAKDIANRRYPGRLVPAQIIGSVYGWTIEHDVHFHFLSSREHAAAAARRLFLVFEKRLDKGEVLQGDRARCRVSPRRLMFTTRYGA